MLTSPNISGCVLFVPLLKCEYGVSDAAQEELQQLREREAQQRQKHEEQMKEMRRGARGHGHSEADQWGVRHGHWEAPKYRWFITKSN